MTGYFSRLLATVLLATLGAALWISTSDLPTDRFWPIGVALGVGFLVGIGSLRAQHPVRWVARLRQSSPAALFRLSILVGLLSGCILYTAAFLRNRNFFPVIHDEHMYLLQTRMLAGGHLWLPAHPLADFFETFFVNARPVYGSIYFPGTALIYVPAVWLGIPVWLWSLAIASLIAGLFFRLLAEWTDAVWALVGVALLLSLPLFRIQAITQMSHLVMAGLGLSLVYAYLHWRSGNGRGWAVLIGALAGLAAITRPLEATAFATAIGTGMMMDLLPHPKAQVTGETVGIAGGFWRRGLKTVACVLAGAVPFLALQVTFNRGVTGHLFRTPYSEYVRLQQPGVGLALRPGPLVPGTRPATSLQQKQDYYDDFLLPAVENFRRRGLIGQWLGHSAKRATALIYLFPHPALLVLCFAGIMGIARSRRWVLPLTLLLLIVLYSFNPILLSGYVMSWTLAAVLLVLLGAIALDELWPAKGKLLPGFQAGLLTLAAGNMLFPARATEVWEAPYIAVVHNLDQALPKRPAVVLFTYERGWNYHQEPVYNIQTPWPDDAEVVRAHDLGDARNAELFQYYADRQPSREVYRINMKMGRIEDLGNVKELALKATAQR